jgi:hypothetical protein
MFHRRQMTNYLQLEISQLANVNGYDKIQA